MNLDRNWILTGSIAGIVTALLYMSIALAILPQVVSRLSFFALGPLTIMTMAGLYCLLKRHRISLSLQLGTMFTMIGGVIMNLTAVVQNSIYSFMQRYFHEAPDETARETIRWMWRGLNSVHLGLDVSFDIFLLSGIFLISISMLSHPRFGKIFGWTGIVLSASTLAINLYTFPTPPGSSPGTGVDLGPLVGIWTLIVSLQMLRSLDWARPVHHESVLQSEAKQELR